MSEAYRQTTRTGTRKIVIDVQDVEAEKTAFIIMPFSSDFNELQTAIEKAANRADLKPYRTDVNLNSDDFVRDIVKQTRRATIVVVVCTPEPLTRHCNLNVMYELGLAHSIGKATIILTTDLETLPTDLKTKQVLKYEPGEEKGKELVYRIADWMNQAKRRLNCGLIDGSNQGIAVVDGFPLSWKNLISILNFAKHVHHHFQELDAAHLNFLVQKINDIVNLSKDPRDPSQKIECETYWNHYVLRYEANCANLRHVCGGDSLMDPALNELKSIGDKKTAELRDTCGNFYDKIKEAMQTYQRHHEKAQERAQGGLVTIFEKGSAQDFLAALLPLCTTAKSLVLLSDNLIGLIVNMVNLILESE